MREDQSAVTGRAAEPHALRGQLHGLPGPAGGVNGRALWCSAGLAPPHSAAGTLQTVPQALPGQAYSILCGRSSSTLGDTVGCLMASLLGSTKSSQHSGGSTNQLVSWCSELPPAEPVTRGCSALPRTRWVRQGGLQPALCRWPGQLAQLCPDQLMQTSNKEQPMCSAAGAVSPACSGVQSSWLSGVPVPLQGLNNGTGRVLLPSTNSLPRRSPLAGGEQLGPPNAGACYRQEQGAPLVSSAARRARPAREGAGGSGRPSPTLPTGPSFPPARAPPGFRWPPRPRKPPPTVAAGGAAAWPQAGARTDRRGRERRGGWRRCGRS